MSVSMQVTIDDAEVKDLIKQLGDRAADFKKPMTIAAEYMRFSIENNFKEGGRPTKWPPSKRAQRQGGQTLRDKGRLLDSITYEAAEDSLRIGTNVKYARIHQFGGIIPGGIIRATRSKALRWLGPDGKPRFAKSVNRPAITIPARPFLVVQDEDVEEIKSIIREYLMSF